LPIRAPRAAQGLLRSVQPSHRHPADRCIITSTGE